MAKLDVQEDGARSRGTIRQATCPRCRFPVEIRVPSVPVSQLNAERARAEGGEALLREAAGDAFALVPTSTLAAITETIDRLAAWIEERNPGTQVHKHNGLVVT